MADQGFKGSGDKRVDSGGGARSGTTMTRVCKSTVMLDPTNMIEQVSLCGIAEDMKETLLVNVINNQRVFNEQVKRAILEAQNRCPGLGTCKGDIEHADFNGQMSTNMTSPLSNTCNQQEKLKSISTKEECVNISSNDKKPLNASPSNKHDFMSDMFDYDQILAKKRNIDRQGQPYTSSFYKQQQNGNDISAASEEGLLNSFSDEDKPMTKSTVHDGSIGGHINSCQRGDSGVDLNKDCPGDGSASVENGTQCSVDSAAVGIAKDGVSQSILNHDCIDDVYDHLSETSHKDAIVQCNFDALIQSSVELSDSVTQTESLYLVDNSAENSKAFQDLEEEGNIHVSGKSSPFSSVTQGRSSSVTDTEEQDESGENTDAWKAEMSILSEDVSSSWHESSIKTDSHLNQSGSNEVSEPKSCVSAYPCCPHMSCLYNQPGKLCTVLGKKFILTTIKDAPILIELKLEMLHGHPCGCLLLWRGKEPVPLASLGDGTKIYFDAVVFPNSSKFTCLVVWQGEKPKVSVEPYFDSYVFLHEVKEINGTLISFEKGMGCVSAIVDGKVEMLSFPLSVFYINGKNVTVKSKILELLAKKDLKVSMDVVKFATTGECVSLCSRVWKGKKPANQNMQIAPNHLTLYRNVQGNFSQHKKQTHLFIDVEANVNMTEDEYYLQFYLDGKEITLPWVDKILHVNNRKTKADVTVRRVRAHILQWIANTNMTAYRFLMVQAYTGRTQQLETDFRKDETKISQLPMEEIHNAKSDTSMLTLTEVSEVNAHDLHSPESNADKHLASEVGQTKDLSVVSCSYEIKGVEDKTLSSEKNLKGKEEQKTKMTKKESTFPLSQRTETHMIQKSVPSFSELIIKSQSVEVEEHIKNTEQLGLYNEKALLTNSEPVAASPKNEKKVKLKEKEVKMSTKSETQNVFIKETPVTQQEPKPLTFQSTLLNIKSKKDKPPLLMNHPGTLLWDTSRSVFVICTRIPFGDIKFSIGARACYILKGNFTKPAQSPNPVPVMFDAFNIGLSNYRLVALWSDVKPPAARTGTSSYHFEVPGVILHIVDKVIDFHVYLNKDEGFIMRAPVPQKVYTSKGDEFTRSLMEGCLIRVHLKVPIDSVRMTDCQILLMVVMVKDGKPMIIKDIMNGRKLNDLKCSSETTNVFDSKKLSDTQALLDHQSAMRDKKFTKVEDLPEYLRNFTGLIVEKKEMGKVILCQLPREVVFIHFTGFVFVEGCAINRSKIPCGTVVQFDAFIKKGDVTSEYSAVFVWTGRRIDGYELNGSRYFYYVPGKYLGKRDCGTCLYELELDGAVCSYTCQKTGNVILPNGKIGSYPLPESRVSAHLKLKRSNRPNEAVTLFVFVEEKTSEPNASHSTCSKEDSVVDCHEDEVCEHVSEQQPQGDLEIDDSCCIYNGSGELVIMEEDNRALKVTTKKTFFLKLSKMQHVFIDSEVKSITDLEEGSIISFDAVHKHHVILLWVGCKPSFYEHSPDVHYAFEVEGLLVNRPQKNSLQVRMRLQGEITTHGLDKTGLIYFKDGRNAKNDVQVGDSLILHLKITKAENKTKIRPLFILVTRGENPDRLESVPQAEEKLFIRIEDQVKDQPDTNILLGSPARDASMNDKILEEKQKATIDYPIKHSVFEGILEKKEDETYQFICQYENQEECITLPVDIPLEQTVKQKHFPFYMIIRINGLIKEKIKSFHPVCGWFKKTASDVYILHNLQFVSVNFAEKIIGLREFDSGKCFHYSLETPFIYFGKTHVTLHEFTHSTLPQLHAVVKDIPITIIDGECITKHILFLTSNMMLSRTALRFLAFSEIDHEFEVSPHSTIEYDFLDQSDDKRLLQAVEFVRGPSQENDWTQSDVLRGDELRARIKNHKSVQDYLILEGRAKKYSFDTYLVNSTYEGNQLEFYIPAESVRIEDGSENDENRWYMLGSSSSNSVFKPILGWCGRTKRDVYILTNQEVVSFNIEYGLIGLASQDEEFYQIYYIDQCFLYSDTGVKLPFKDLLPLKDKPKKVNVVVEDIEVRKVHGHLVCKKVLFISSKQGLTLACAKIFTQPQEEELPLSHVSNTTIDSDGKLTYKDIMIQPKLTYKDIKIQPKPTSCVTYGMFHACAVMDTYTVLSSKTRKVIVGLGDLYCGGEKVVSYLHKVLQVGCAVAAYAIEMKEPIITPSFPISEVAVFAFIGKKPNQSKAIIDEWNLSPKKVLWLPGRQKANTFTLDINVNKTYLSEKKLGVDSSGVVAVKEKAKGNAEAQKVKKEIKPIPPSTPQKKKAVLPQEGASPKKKLSDNCMTKGKIFVVSGESGILKRSNGKCCNFRSHQVFLYGVCLQGMPLPKILCAGIEVEYEMCDNMTSLKGIWVGSNLPLEPSVLYDKLERWCQEYSVPQELTFELLCSTGWLPDDLEPTIDFDADKEIVEVSATDKKFEKKKRKKNSNK